MDGLAFTLPVTFVACNVQQVLIGIDIILTYNLCGIGNYLLGNAYLSGYLDSKATTRVANLQLEESLHTMAVVKHSSVYYARGIFGKVLQVLVVGGDNTIGTILDESLQDSFGNGSSDGWLRTASKLVDEQQAVWVTATHHILHIQEMAAVGT